ncbi:hypothetical protein [uncultured Halomonas sp.]|uniref:hypothetical protein n=1 Tax=uncultured Halomonas sp. TaxID=173971 RepID=UPI002603031C|nr:hypothetical protein [uncultured Halomonas sp.]
MAEAKTTQAKRGAEADQKPADKPTAGQQVSLALANLVSSGMSLKEARKRLGEG